MSEWRTDPPPEPLTLEQFDAIAKAIERRQDAWKEPLHTSVMVVLCNAGDAFVNVQCIAGEWSGTKAEIPRDNSHGIPKCPNGHVLMETSEAPSLAFIAPNMPPHPEGER